jgi:replicative DNA helicase
MAPVSAAEQQPPHSTEAEQSAIGAVLNDNRAFDAVAELIGAADFYRLEHRVTWSAIAMLVGRGQPADVITVHEVLRSADQHELASLQYLNALLMSVPGAGNALAYARIVQRMSAARKLIALADDLGRRAHQAAAHDDGPAALVDSMVLRLLELQQGVRATEPRVIGEALPAWIDEINSRAEGKTDSIATGLADVDRLLAGGLRRGELAVIGARPSMGKSALMLTMARNVARTGTVLVCSMEDSELMLVSRQVAAAGRVNLADIRSPARAPASLWGGVSDAVEMLSPLRLWFDDRPGLRLEDVRRKALQVQRKDGDLVLLVLDYLQLMEGDGETRAYELAAVARGLKRMAKELRCAVLLLSQLSRKADETDGPPRLDHLAETGGLEQAADIIGLLWREARRKPRPENKHRAQIEFVKQKNGPTDTVHLWFDGATQRFEDATLGDGDVA